MQLDINTKIKIIESCNNNIVNLKDSNIKLEKELQEKKYNNTVKKRLNDDF